MPSPSLNFTKLDILYLIKCGSKSAQDLKFFLSFCTCSMLDGICTQAKCNASGWVYSTFVIKSQYNAIGRVPLFAK